MQLQRVLEFVVLMYNFHLKNLRDYGQTVRSAGTHEEITCLLRH